MTDVDELVAWLHQQLGADEQWALAASRAYPYADPPAVAPATGVHWRWVAGDDWHTVTPDPVVDEFVAGAGKGCNLATVEEWSAGNRPMPQTYANEIVEMDASAAGHIIRHDPAHVLGLVAAHRRLLDLAERFDLDAGDLAAAGEPEFLTLRSTARLIRATVASAYADRPGYRPEWTP